MTITQQFEVDPEANKGDAAPLASAPVWALVVVNIVVFGVNFFAVRLGGRLDGVERDTLNYLSPSGYAFAIWGVIFVSETAFCVWMALRLFIGKSDKWESNIRALTPGWIAGNISQVLWCVFYRPRFEPFGLQWISVLMLASIAISLSFAHREVTARAEGVEENVFMVFPISVHFGWTTAASLVNLNGWWATGKFRPSVGLVVLFMSLVLAGVIGAGLTVRRSATVYGLTIAWAVIAVAVYTLTSSEFVDEFGAAGTRTIGVIEIVEGVSLVGLCIGIIATRIMGGKQAREADIVA